MKTIEGGNRLETELEDRGDVVYKIREINSYRHLKDARFSADGYHLNRSAKVTFTCRMGVKSINFGSIFGFQNGFRVLPICSKYDDFFGINKRNVMSLRLSLRRSRYGIPATSLNPFAQHGPPAGRCQGPGNRPHGRVRVDQKGAARCLDGLHGERRIWGG